MFRKFIIICMIFPNILFSQIQNSAYNSLNLHSSSRILSMGGEVISIFDNDVSLVSLTPSLLNQKMDKHISFNFVDYIADVNFISFYSAHKMSDNLMLFLGIDAINYGEFSGADIFGRPTNYFNASDQIITIGGSKKISDYFIFGSNIKLLNSKLETYHSMTLSSNISTTYINRESNFSSTLLIKNIGKPIINYTLNKEDLPFEVQLGLSKSLKYLPFTYSLVLHHLNQYDLSDDYNLNTIYDPITNTVQIKDETVVKKLLRHVIIGGELNPFRKAFYLRGGFNFQRREDLKLSSAFTMSGFSFGVGCSLKKIQINYSRSAFHTASSLNSFSTIINLSSFGF